MRPGRFDEAAWVEDPIYDNRAYEFLNGKTYAGGWFDGNGFSFSGGTEDQGDGADDFIFKNKKGKEIARIVTPGKTDIEINVDTDLSPPQSIIIKPKIEADADAIGLNIEDSITVGGGMHAGIGYVYFLNGNDSGSLFSYDFSGGNVGLGGGIGIAGFASYFNSQEVSNELFGVKGFQGNYNGYSASFIVEAGMSWSNVNNTRNELWPGMKSPWTWKSKSLGAGGGFEFDARFLMGESKNFKKLY